MSDNQKWSILQGDALKVLGTFAPNTFDAVITDPPYASGGRTQTEKNKSTARKYSSMGENAPPPFDGDAKDQRSWTRWAAEWLYEARKVCKSGAPVCMFIDWRQLPAATDALQWAGWIWRGTAVWDKGNSRPQKGRFRQQAEYIVWGSNGDMPISRPVPCLPGVFKYGNPQSRIHLTEKPLQLMRDIVKITEPGGHKVTDSSNSVVQERYITLSVHKKNVEEARAFFDRTVHDASSRLNHMDSHCEDMDAADRLHILHDFYRVGEESEFRFDLRENMKNGRSFKDAICPDSMEFKKDHFIMGGKYGRVLFLKEYASYIKDSMINELTSLNRSLMLSIDIIPVPTDEAVREMQNRLLGVETNVTNWQRRQNANNNFSAVVPYDLEQQRKETREMLDDLTTRDQRMMFAVVTLVHLADSKEELDSDTETLQSIARKHLCQLTTLNWQQADGLVTALPLGLRRIDALRTLTTEALAVLMPFKAQEIWDRGGVYYGQNAISKNLIVADRRQLLNGNAFILGVSGSGKSFSAKKEMVSLALSTQDDIIVIDPESEYRPLIEGLGGQVINISATSPNHINAMDMEQGYGDGENPVVLKSEFLLSLCEQLIGAGKLSAKEKSVIDRCTAQVYRDYIRSGYHGAVPTLQDFHAELLRQPEKEAQDVALAIELFTDGSLNTFAKPTNVDTNARILCYDIRDLGKQLLPVGMLVVLDSIFNRIIRNRGLKRNTWIYIDEIYLLFQHEYSANFLFTLWKRMRKYQACGTGISQNIEDLLQSHTARTMLANSEFLIMLNQAATDREELARLLNISDNQLSYITNVDSGRGLIKCGSAIVPFVDHFPKNKLYRLMTTKPSDLAA